MVPGNFGKKMEKNKLVKKNWSSKCCKKITIKKNLVKKKLEENLGWEKIESKKLLVSGKIGVKILKKKTIW